MSQEWCCRPLDKLIDSNTYEELTFNSFLGMFSQD